MTAAHFFKLIEINNVPKHRYSVNQGLKDDAHHLYLKDGQWQCFYFERGVKGRPIFVESEEEGYDVLWYYIEEDLHVFKKPVRTLPKPRENFLMNLAKKLFTFFNSRRKEKG